MKNFFNRSKGFTLIELLIVIAIIGILSTIVLTALSNSRAKANDAKVMMELRGFRAAAENYYNSQNPAGYAAPSGSPGDNIISCSNGMFNDVDPKDGSPQLYIAVGSLPNDTQVFCGATQFAFAVKATLTSGPNPGKDYWCVDNKGFSGRVVSNILPTVGTICP
jgi:prepilin-type N-terminal cleavage/methylation domain-containing protein